MRNILNNRRLISLMFFVMSVGILVSCKKDNIENSGKVELLSFGPTGAMHGDTLHIIGNNLDKVTQVDLTGASIAKSAFVEQGPESILIIIPAEAARGLIVLKTGDGEVVSKTILNLEVVVSVTSITGEARPGENITIKGEYLNWITQVIFAKDKVVDSLNFISKSLTELVVKVPEDAQSGALIINSGGTKPLSFETDSSLKVTLPSVTSISPIPVERDANITITGTNLDLTSGILFKGVNTPVTEFVSKTATQIVVKAPADANKGKISLVAYSGLTVESAQSVLFVGDLPDLEPLAYAMYIDDFQNNWQDWGWSRTADYKSGDNVRDGVASIKLQYTGEWGGLKFANSSVSTANYTQLTFSIFGTPGTGGKKINMAPSGGSTYEITIEEGKWVEYKLTMAQVGNPATISELMFQNQSWTGTIFLDHVGLR